MNIYKFEVVKNKDDNIHKYSRALSNHIKDIWKMQVEKLTNQQKNHETLQSCACLGPMHFRYSHY